MESKITVYRGYLTLYFSHQGIFRKSLGIKVDPKDSKRILNNLKKDRLNDFDDDTKKIIVSTKKEVDNIIIDHLLKHNTSITKKELVSRIASNKRGELSELMLTQFDLFIEDKKDELLSNGYKLISLKDYSSLRNALIDYETEFGCKLSVYDIDTDFIKKLVRFLRGERRSTNGKIFITKGGINNKTLSKRLSILKQFIRFLPTDIKKNMKCSSDEIVDFVKKKINLKVRSKDIKRLALNKEDIEEFIKIPVSNKREQFVRDWFFVASFTGLRYGDMIRLKTEDVEKIEQMDVIGTSTSKTFSDVQIVLKDECLRILNRYDFNMKIPNSSINKEIKLFLKKSEHFRQPYPKYKKKDGTPYLKYELVTTHTGRRTLITRLFNELQVSANKVMNISGHLKLSTLDMYAQKADELVDINQL